MNERPKCNDCPHYGAQDARTVSRRGQHVCNHPKVYKRYLKMAAEPRQPKWCPLLREDSR